jgi:hypothetical protein
MRKQVVRVVILLSFFTLLCAAAHAQSAYTPMRAHIPFSFSIGRETMPAGDYHISFVNTESNPHILAIKSPDGRIARFMQMSTVEGKARERGRLIFNRYDSQYFLSQVWKPAERTGLVMRRSRAEREVELAGGGHTTRATVSVASGK